MESGKVRRIMDRGYGFITPDNGGKDLFFHANDVTQGVDFKGLQEGQAVQYEVKQGKKGPMAVNVTTV